MGRTGDDDRRWAADKRDFVADSRDDAADQRDTTADTRDAVADTREAVADAREAALDTWEQQLAARARELGLAVGLGDSAAAGDGGRAARDSAGHARTDARREREEQQASREAATERRLAEDRPTLLALAFAEIAEQLYDAETYDDVLTKIAEAAVATVAGGELASVTLREAGGYRTAGATHQQASAVDQEQYEADEGPSLDALSTPLVDAPSFPDERWPVLGDRPVEHGVESSVSYRLGPGHGEGAESSLGSLNIYALAPEAFDEAALEIGSILAAHASLAARAVGERASLDDLGRHLQRALLSRDVIGQAKGILMERLRTTPEDAFEILKRSSQRLNVKLRDIARRLTETGDVDRIS